MQIYIALNATQQCFASCCIYPIVTYKNYQPLENALPFELKKKNNNSSTGMYIKEKLIPNCYV